MLILFENYFKESKRDVLLKCAPNNETYIAIKHLSENDIEQFFNDCLTEGVFSWVKDKLSDLGGAIKNVATKAFNSLANFIQTIKTSISEFLNNAYLYYKDKFIQPLNAKKDEIYNIVLNKLKTVNKAKIKGEVTSLKDSLNYLVKYYTGGVDKDLTIAAKKVASDENITESIFNALSENPNLWNEILESDNHHSDKQIPFISKIAHKIAEYPPFSYLHKIQHSIEKFSNYVFDKLSEFSQMLGGPKATHFEIIGALIGLVGEYFVKGIAVSGIAEIGKFISGTISTALLSAIPIVTVILKTIKYTALGLWIVGLIELVLKAI